MHKIVLAFIPRSWKRKTHQKRKVKVHLGIMPRSMSFPVNEPSPPSCSPSSIPANSPLCSFESPLEALPPSSRTFPSLLHQVRAASCPLDVEVRDMEGLQTEDRWFWFVDEEDEGRGDREGEYDDQDEDPENAAAVEEPSSATAAFRFEAKHLWQHWHCDHVARVCPVSVALRCLNHRF